MCAVGHRGSGGIDDMAEVEDAISGCHILDFIIVKQHFYFHA